MTVLAVVTAAGSGSRLGHRLPKACVPLGDQPLVVHAVRRVIGSGVVDKVIVTAPPAWCDHMAEVFTHEDLGMDIRIVPGGVTRQASVQLALMSAAADPDIEVVLVHDAARALAPSSLVQRVVAAVRSGHPAVIPALPMADTVKQVDGGEPEVVTATVDRTWLRIVQTPQGFDRLLLQRAHAHAVEYAADERIAATDDAGLVESLGHRVVVIPGDAQAMKITTSHDLAVAHLLLQER